MSSHEFSFRYIFRKAVKLLRKDLDIDKSDDENMPKNLQAWESDWSSDKTLCDHCDAGSSSKIDSDGESSSSRQCITGNGET